MDSKMGYDSTDSKVIESKDTELEKECTICFINEKNTLLPCEHKVCEKCYKNIEACPFCRIKINKPKIHISIELPMNPSSSTQVDIQIEPEPCYTKYYIFIFVFAAVVPIIWFGYGIMLFRNK